MDKRGVFLSVVRLTFTDPQAKGSKNPMWLCGQRGHVMYHILFSLDLLLAPVMCGTDQLWYCAAYQHQTAGAVGRDVQHSAPN